jgi:hydrogenase-4 component E
MLLVDLAASKAMGSAAVLLFLTLLLLAAAKRISTSIVAFALQSAILGAQVLAVARVHGSAESYFIGALVILIKVLVIPYALFRLVEKLHAPRDVKLSLSPVYSVFITTGVIFLSFTAVHTYVQELRVAEDVLAAAVALILSGSFLMVSHGKALMQIIALLVLENGIFLAALITTFGMPMIIEIGVFFDLLMGVLLMGIFTFRIRDTFADLDVSKLRRLRG